MKKSKKLSLALALAMSFSSIPGAMAEETSTEAETTAKTGYVYDFEDYAVGRIKEGNNVTGIFTMSYLNWPPLNHGTPNVDGSYIAVDPITNNNAVRITENKVGQILNFNLPEIVKEKKVDVSFDFRIESLVETIDEETGEVTVTREPSYRYITSFGTLVGEDATVAHTFTYQNQLKNTVPATIFDFNTADPTKYNKMKYSLDFENGTYDIYINNVKKSSGLKLGDDELKKMMFQVRHDNTANSKQNNTTNIWIDNFKVLPRDNKNITFEDYEEGEVIDLISTSVQSGNSIGIAKDGDNTALKVVQTNGSSTSFDVKLPKSEGGIYRVSFDTKFVTPLKRFYPFGELYGGDDKITYSYGSGRKIQYGDSNTTILNTEACDQTKYYNFDIIVDFDKQEYSMYLDGAKKVTSNFRTTSKRVEYLDKLTFKIDGWTTENNSESSRPGTSTYYFDNFKIEKLDYTFEGYDEGENAFGVIKTAVDSGDSIGVAKDGDNKALKMVKTDSQKLTGFTVDLPKKEGGIVEVSFDAKFENAVKKFSSFADLYAGDKRITVSYAAGSKIKYGDTIYNQIIDTANTEDRYYNFKTVVDFNNKYYSIFVDGTQVGTTYSFKDVEYVDKIKFEINGWTDATNSEAGRAGTSTYYFDNFAVRQLDYTFDGYNEGETVKGLTVTASNNDSVSVAKDGDNMALKVVKTDATSNIDFAINLPETKEDIVEVSFDAKFAEGNKRIKTFAALSGDRKGITNSYSHGTQIRYGKNTTTNAGNVFDIATAERDKYYNFKIVVDFISNTYTLYIDGIEKSVVRGSEFENAKCVDKIAFCVEGWYTEDTTDASGELGEATYWFDNFAVTGYDALVVTPEMSEPENNVSLVTASAKNDSLSNIGRTLFVAVYKNDGSLYDVASCDFTVESAGTNDMLQAVIDIPAEGEYSVCGFVWDEGSLKPLGEKIVIK